MRRKKVQDDNPTGRLGEFGSAVAQIAEEKGISKDKVIETIEAALSAAYKKDYGKKGQNIRAEFDEVTGDTNFYLVKEVVDKSTREFTEEKTGEELKEISEKKKEGVKSEKEEKAKKEEESDEEKLPRFNPERDIILEDAKKMKKGAKIGDVMETKLESKKDYGRIAAQTAKQVIIQRIREAERESMYKEYKEKEGEVISGTVQRIEGRNVYVDLGKSVGVLFPMEQIRGEHYRIGQRIKVYLVRVEADAKGPGITLSRTHPEMIRKLFELEVPEIFSGTVEIKAIAREAGARTKIAVDSKEEGVDPIGSCVGQKGTRVQAVIDELGGEKIDIIEWREDAEKFISAALSPAKVLAVKIDDDRKEAAVKVPEDQLSLAIGKQGQNVRLAVKLTGYRIDVAGEKIEEKVKEASEKVEEIEDENKDNGEKGKEKGEKGKESENENENENESKEDKKTEEGKTGKKDKKKKEKIKEKESKEEIKE